MGDRLAEWTLSATSTGVGDRRPFCWLAVFGVMEHGDGMPSCSGQLVHCHLIRRQVIRRHGGDVDDPRSWVWGCDGGSGVAGHHGLFDTSRRLRVPRGAIPVGTERFAAELGLVWWLDREYGERPDVA